jgi:hypothetical protein
MSVFTDEGIDYLRQRTLGRVRTVGSDGHPHATPVTLVVDADQDTIDVDGIFVGDTKEWQDAQRNPKVTGEGFRMNARSVGGEGGS